MARPLPEPLQSMRASWLQALAVAERLDEDPRSDVVAVAVAVVDAELRWCRLCAATRPDG